MPLDVDARGRVLRTPGRHVHGVMRIRRGPPPPPITVVTSGVRDAGGNSGGHSGARSTWREGRLVHARRLACHPPASVRRDRGAATTTWRLIYVRRDLHVAAQRRLGSTAATTTAAATAVAIPGRGAVDGVTMWVVNSLLSLVAARARHISSRMSRLWIVQHRRSASPMRIGERIPERQPRCISPLAPSLAPPRARGYSGHLRRLAGVACSACVAVLHANGPGHAHWPCGVRV